jgi:hypothetical protein
MKRSLSMTSMLVVACAIGAAAPAAAATLYDNGAADPTISARPINFGNAYANSFTLAQDSTVTGVNFTSFDFPSVSISNVSWAITPAVNFAAAATSAAVSSSYLFTQGNGYRLDNNSFSTGALSLAAGTYYLLLENAVTTAGGSAYWGVSDGPSIAYGNGFRYEQSEAFQIIGTPNASAVPEPASWAMMIGGVGVLGGALRRRAKATLAVA